MNGLRWRNWKIRLAVKLAIACGALALAAHGVFGPDGLLVYMQKRHEYSSLHQQIKEAQRQNQDLQKEVQNLKSNPASIERYAREDLHMARSKEMIYMLPPPSKASGKPGSGKP